MSDENQERSGQRVLIVDDDENMREIFSFQVRQLIEEEPCLAANAAEAISKVDEAAREGRPFNLILMDIRMPNMDGVQASKLLREAGFKGVIAACTAVSSGTGRRESIDAGIDVYVDKRYVKKETIQALLDQALSLDKNPC